MVTFIKTISDFSKAGDYPRPKHPYLALVKIENVGDRINLMPKEISLGFHTIGLKKNLKGYLKYGRKTYDFQEGVLAFTAPHQVISFDNLIVDESAGWYLFFDKALLSDTSLSEKFDRYSFFNYNINEALHLSQEEEIHMDEIFHSLFNEYNKSIDALSKQLLVNHLEMILTYSERYYNRQFITRKDGETSFLRRFEEILQGLCSLENLSSSGIPTVRLVAEEMHLSANYLSDAIRNATGMSTQKHIHLRLVELAKEQLLVNSQSVSEVAFKLGFESHTYFSRLFKKLEGITPKEYIELN